MTRTTIALLLLALLGPAAHAQKIKVEETKDHIQIDTDALEARIAKTGYVSGIARGSFLDKKTGARDPGFGLHIMDFLLGPGWKDDTYGRDEKTHGKLAHHFIEGPQICTQARKLEPVVVRGKDALAVKMSFRFTEGHNGFKPGSLWEQTIVFQPGKRWVLCGERITSANDVPSLIYRIDMPGHVKHKRADTFESIYLSYHGKIPSTEFFDDFAPDARYLYQRGKDKEPPRRMIRAYELKQGDKFGPWLGGLTLDPSLTYQAWCHQRGYVCFIQELWGKSVKAGETIGAAYIVGYFDSIDGMNEVYDQYRNTRFQDLLGFKQEK